MTRWALEDLVDYARGVALPERKAAIEADLAAGGPRPEPSDGHDTRVDLELLAEVSAALREDRAQGPSADTLLAVSALFGAASRDADSVLPLLPLLSVIDPMAGLAAGLRSAQLGHRDLQIHGQRFDLDLSVDTPYDAIDVVIVGRLTRAEAEPWSVERVPAVLVARGEVLAGAVTNRFGEFHVAAQSEEDDVELCILIAGVGQIRIPIDRRDPLLTGSA